MHIVKHLVNVSKWKTLNLNRQVSDFKDKSLEERGASCVKFRCWSDGLRHPCVCLCMYLCVFVCAPEALTLI